LRWAFSEIVLVLMVMDMVVDSGLTLGRPATMPVS
jgi:hypothetical protein